MLSQCEGGTDLPNEVGGKHFAALSSFTIICEPSTTVNSLFTTAITCEAKICTWRALCGFNLVSVESRVTVHRFGFILVLKKKV